MATPVTMRIQSDDVSPVRIAGVVVQVYQANTTTFVTSGTTDINGEAALLLPDASYDILFYKQGVSILPRQPQRIVVDHTLSNIFLVTGHIKALPESTDPILCKVSGYVRGGDGQPLTGSKLYFFPVYDPVVISANIVPSQSIFRVQSDNTGYMEFTLLREMKYKAYTEARGVTLNAQHILGELDVVAPNMPGIDISLLLYPIPTNFVFESTTLTISLAAGPNTSQSPTVTYSDYSTRTIPPSWTSLTLTVSNPSILTIELQQDGNLAISPLSIGTALVTVARNIDSNAFFSNPPIFTSNTMTVTVES